MQNVRQLPQGGALYNDVFYIFTTVHRIKTKLSTFIVSALLRTSDEGFTDPPLGDALVPV